MSINWRKSMNKRNFFGSAAALVLALTAQLFIATAKALSLIHI